MSTIGTSFEGLSEAISRGICEGMTEGNRGLSHELEQYQSTLHSMSNKMQVAIAKTYELDGEVKLLKGVIVSLNGDGSGNGGSIPRLEREMGIMKNDFGSLRVTISTMGNDVAAMKASLVDIAKSQSITKSWMDGGRGVVFILGFASMVLTFIGTCVAGLFWLFHQGPVIH